MSADVVYDANVLYPSTLRDVLIRVGLARLAYPKWTERILDEVFRNLRANRPDLDPTRLDRTRRLMNDAIRDVTVTGYGHLIDQLDLPDADDRHVLAAAIHADALVIVTRNLRDFPADRLSTWGMEAQHPDDFLPGLHQEHPGALEEIVVAIAHACGDEAKPGEALDHLTIDVPNTAARVRRPSQIADKARFTCPWACFPAAYTRALHASNGPKQHGIEVLGVEVVKVSTVQDTVARGEAEVALDSSRSWRRHGGRLAGSPPSR